jgi:hypothetical protein
LGKGHDFGCRPITVRQDRDKKRGRIKEIPLLARIVDSQVHTFHRFDSPFGFEAIVRTLSGYAGESWLCNFRPHQANHLVHSVRHLCSDGQNLAHLCHYLRGFYCALIIYPGLTARTRLGLGCAASFGAWWLEGAEDQSCQFLAFLHCCVNFRLVALRHEVRHSEAAPRGERFEIFENKTADINQLSAFSLETLVCPARH